MLCDLVSAFPQLPGLLGPPGWKRPLCPPSAHWSGENPLTRLGLLPCWSPGPDVTLTTTWARCLSLPPVLGLCSWLLAGNASPACFPVKPQVGPAWTEGAAALEVPLWVSCFQAPCWKFTACALASLHSACPLEARGSLSPAAGQGSPLRAGAQTFWSGCALPPGVAGRAPL